MSPDPWTAFLDWLTTVLVPSWSELIGLLPIVVTGMVIGPILTIIVLMWGWTSSSAAAGTSGAPSHSPVSRSWMRMARRCSRRTYPTVEEHALVYPPRAKQCNVDQAELRVSCPVDGTIRLAAIDICASCGTKFTLGAGSGAVVVTSAGGPPPGGAAIA